MYSCCRPGNRATRYHSYTPCLRPRHSRRVCFRNLLVSMKAVENKTMNVDDVYETGILVNISIRNLNRALRNGQISNKEPGFPGWQHHTNGSMSGRKAGLFCRHSKGTCSCSNC